MKILMVTPEFPPKCGGIGWYVYYLCNELNSRGHIITLMLRSTNHVESFEHLPTILVNVGRFPYVNAWKMVKKVSKYLDENPHDLSIIHSTPIGAWLSCFPTILVSHWCIAEGQKRFYAGARDVSSILHLILGKLYTATERKSILSASAVTVVSKAMEREIFAHYRRSAVYVGNAVDKTTFCPSDTFESRGVLLPSMLRAGKGIREALEVIRQLRKAGCDIPFKFVGSGPMKSWLSKKLLRMSMKNVQLSDPVEHSKLNSLYQNSSIVFLPSYYEGLPTVALEAMASGVPVVATDVGGTAEAVSDGKTGFIHRVSDLSGMARSITRLDSDSSLRKLHGRNGRKRVLNNFNWQLVGNRFECLIHSLL